MTRLAVLLLAMLAAVGCTRSEDKDVTPWFKVRVHSTPNIGGFSGGVTSVQAYVKRYGFWHRIAEQSGTNALVLDPRTVLFPLGTRMHLVHEGESEARPACEHMDAAITLPPVPAAYDCVDTLEGTPFIPARVRWRRLDAEARATADQILEPGVGRVFMGGTVRFYDRAGAPYFVTRTPDDGAAACVLQGAGSARSRTVVAREGGSLADCSSAVPWSRIAGFPLESAR